jgi:asparaginyl-tRNA synthetase
MEAAWMSFDELLEFIEDFTLYIRDHVLKTCEKELISLGTNIEALRQVKKPFIRIKYEDALKR